MTKIAFISDVHANYEALSAMLRRLDAVGCDAIVCLGDIVGYGASPSECISLIREREIPCVMGNHDEYATMMLDMNPSVSHLREEIRQSIAWTQSQLSTDELKWLASLRMRMEDSEFMALHSSFAHGRWAYCMNEGSFAANFERQPCQLAFCGHSHSPLIGIDVGGGRPPFVDFIRPYTLPTDHKIMVNVGSVGQPRDRDNRACACLYELETRRLELIREPYDIAMAQNKIYMARLPEKFATRLDFGR